MGTRLELHQKLVDILGSPNVYFQPPENVKLKFPCIIYEREGKSVRFADNDGYFEHMQYKITVVDRNPDSELPTKIDALPYCRMSSHYVTDNLNHDIFTIYW